MNGEVSGETMKRIYLDNAATTHVKEEVLQAMLPYFGEVYGNPSSLHACGREAYAPVSRARESVAAAVHADEREIYFTSGGTESDNWAIKGAARANRKKGSHLITTAVEHHAVLDSFRYLEKNGFDVTYLPADSYGMVHPQQLAEAIKDQTILVSVMLANNEIGTIMPIKELAAVAKEKGVLFHTDAVQAVGHIPVAVADLGVDMLSMSAHKFHGPKGVGALYIKKGTRIEKYMHGGAQERNLRAGTENVPGIVGMGKAIAVAGRDMDKNTRRIQLLRDRLIEAVLRDIPYTKLNGHPKTRLPNNINFSFEFIEGEALLVSLDLKGVLASSGSACTSGSFEPSYVLIATGVPPERAQGSVRLTLGEDNTEEEIDYTIEAIKETVNRLREISSLFAQKEGETKYV